MPPDTQQRVVIVDGYATGGSLLRELLELNVECLHLRSSDRFPALVTAGFDPRPYDGDLGHVGDVRSATRLLSELRPDAVVAGSEWGVTFAERTAHGLGLPTNLLETLTARRDKFAMTEAVRRAGLLAPDHLRTAAVEIAHAWADRRGAWPIVVKPAASTGSDGVSLCGGHAELDRAFAAILDRENLVGEVNRRLLLQSFLGGPQYVINTVSWGGRHMITDAWEVSFSERDARLLPRTLSLLDPALPRTAELADYALRVLEALGVRNGAAHTELAWTHAGPALIETGARLMAAPMDPSPYGAAGLETQAAVYAQILAGSDDERDALLRQRSYSPRRHMAKLLFSFEGTGRVRSLAGLDRLRGLASFYAHYRPLAPGDWARPTAAWIACGGVVYLVHDDPGQVGADVRQFRAWERQGELYGLDLIETAGRSA